MSDLAYMIDKGLPSALRAIPKGGVMSNPYIAGRVVAHDRGTAAGTLIGHAKKYEAKAVARHPLPTRRRMVLAPPLALRDVALHHDSMNTVHSTLASAERIKTQGKQARRFSREHIGKGLAMSERDYLIDKAYRGIGGKPSKGVSEEAKKLLLKRANSRSTRLIPPGLSRPEDLLASRQFSTRRPPPSISKAAATKDHPKGEYRPSLMNKFPGKREKGVDTHYRRGTVIRRNARQVGISEGHALAGGVGGGALGAGIGAGVGRLSHLGARRGAEYGASLGIAGGGLAGQFSGQARARNRNIETGDVKLIARGGPNKGKRVKRQGFFKPVYED